MEPVAIITIIALLQTFLFAWQVGQVRARTGVRAPAVTGHEDFERAFRVHQNTLEQLVLFVPALWIFGRYVDPMIGAGIGLVFIIGRFLYRNAYVRDPAARGAGFALGALATLALMLGGLVGAALALVGR